jgi:AraC family transcriptional regulator
MLPRSNVARGCFPEDWGPHRFERIGDLFLLPANHLVRAQSECRHQHSIVCSFAAEALESMWLANDIEWTASRLRASLDIPNSSIRSLLFRLGEETRDPGFASEAMIEMMTGQIAIELARYCLGVQDSRATGGLSRWRLQLIDERLAQEGTPPTLAELAGLCGISVRHLTRAFRVSRCRSIGDYIAEHRIDQSKQMLAAGQCVKAIAYSMGFSSPAAFSTAFRRATGEAPRQYRDRARAARKSH